MPLRRSRVSGCWCTSTRAVRNRARYAAHRRLRPVVRIGPKELSVDCIEDGVKTVYGGGFVKDGWYARAFRREGGGRHFCSSSRLLGSLTVGVESRTCLLHFQGRSMQSASECSRVCTHSLTSRVRRTGRKLLGSSSRGRMRTQSARVGSGACDCECSGKEQRLHYGLDYLLHGCIGLEMH